MQALFSLAYLFLPLLGGALFQAGCMRFGWLHSLYRPIDLGREVRGCRVFGDNKTFRGLVSGTVGSGVVAAFQGYALHADPAWRALEYFDYGSIQPILFGAGLGFVAMVSELPNSFAKRRLGIAPGAPAKGSLALLFYVIDQVDVLLGSWCLLAFYMDVTPSRVAGSIALIFVIHQALTLAGYFLGVRETVR